MSSRLRSAGDDLNAYALEQFVHSPVSHDMVVFLAAAASNVIQCDPNMMPPTQAAQNPTPPRTPSPQAVRCEDSALPTLEEFITRLIVSSNVQVPTLMSTLVYLTKLRARLQPMAKGLRCTTHRIFLAALILSAKYLNDSSPKNKHWASYSRINCDSYSFGFSKTEVNLMEKQLLFLLDWELRITEEDLYRELDFFLEPIRQDIQNKLARKEQRKQQREVESRARMTASQLPSPPSSRGSSRSRSGHRHPTLSHESTIRVVHDVSSISTPPALGHGYSSSVSSSSSFTSSLASRQHSRSSTPMSDPEVEPYVTYLEGSSLYESPVEIILDMPEMAPLVKTGNRRKQLLPYEISAEALHEMQDGGAKAKRPRTGRGVWNRMFGTTVPAQA